MDTIEPEVRILTREDAEKYLAMASGLASLGDKLVLRIAEEVLETHRERLRSALPAVVLRPIPPRRPYTRDRPVAYDQPTRAPTNFRSLPPCQKRPEKDPPGGGYTITYVGSGVRTSKHPLAKDWFSRCMHCASTDTRVIYASSSAHFGRVETSRWHECEYECRECGKYNYHQVHYED